MDSLFGGSGPHLWHGPAARVIGAIYRDPTGGAWAEALDILADIHEAPWAHIHIDDNDIDAPRISVPNASADGGILHRQLVGGYGRLDPRPALLTANEGTVTACWQLLDPAEFDRSTYVNEFLDIPENNLRWSMAGGRALASGTRVLFGVARPRHAGPFDAEDVLALSGIAPHILGAVEMHEALRLAQRAALLPTQIGERRRTALVGVDRRGRIAYYNVRAGALLVRGGDVRSHNGQLKFVSPRVQAAFEATMAASADAPGLKLSDGLHHYRLYAVPQLATPVAGALPPIHVLIEMHEIPASSVATTLSPRERQVAELLSNGMSLPQIAVRLGKSIETVRTQLKTAMRKLKVNSQSQLVRIMLAEWEG